MKKKSLLLILLVFVFAINIFSQTQTPLEVATEFCNLALKNDFDTAKQYLDTKSFVSFKQEVLKIDFRSVSNKGFEQIKPVYNQVLPRTAKFIFVSNAVYKNLTIEVSLVKFLTNWKISSFNSKIVQNLNFISSQNHRPYIGPIPQYSPFSAPIKPNEPRIIAEPYSPEKNPVRFLEVNPKDY